MAQNTEELVLSGPTRGAGAGETVQIIDTSIRDGQMSLWATGMTTASILPLARDYNAANFAALEILGAAFFKKLVRELKDNPFDRVRRFRELAPDATLRVIHSRHALAFQITPPDVYRLLTEQLKLSGVDEVRMSDPSNTIATHVRNKSLAEAAGLRVIINLVYSSSPKHSDEYFREKARAVAALAPAEICIKDPGGLLTPERVRTLVPTVQAEIGAIPLSFHGHCNNGLGMMNVLEAVELGIRKVDVAVPPLANGASLPSVVVLARNLRARGYKLDIDDAAIDRISTGLEEFRVATDRPVGRTAEYDETYYTHQVPGGMISNLRFQLGNLGMGDRVDEVLEEVGRVRQDLGYPIMVTPYSQFVGTQATLNVTTGTRYGQVVDEILQYAAGMWGQEERDDIDPDVLDRLMSNPRAAEVASGATLEEMADQPVSELRRRIGATDVSDEEFLLRFFTTEADVIAMNAAPGLSRAAVEDPWVALVERAGGIADLRRLGVRKGASSVLVGR